MLHTDDPIMMTGRRLVLQDHHLYNGVHDLMDQKLGSPI